MRTKAFTILTVTFFSLAFLSQGTNLRASNTDRFNKEKDLLLAHYDFKTDVDDLHSAAALFTLLNMPGFSDINHHAVAGAYGTQGGLYVPPNELMQAAFGDNWSDAHEDRDAAVELVKKLAEETLTNGGDVWVAEGGQSDFTAQVLRAIRADHPQLKTAKRFHVVQHSDWNEEVTSPESLQFVKQKAHYHRIPDGNGLDNGTPGFRSPGYTNWKAHIEDPEVKKVWQMAIELANQYNGKEDRYNNEAIAEGGLDFSDFSEVCWMLGLENLRDSEAFFDFYSNKQ